MLTDALREAQSQNKDLSRQVQELMTVRVQLQNERDGLSAELSETKDALKDATARLEASNAALTQLRTDMEHRLREKDDEIDNIRWVGLADNWRLEIPSSSSRKIFVKHLLQWERIMRYRLQLKWN